MITSAKNSKDVSDNDVVPLLEFSFSTFIDIIESVSDLSQRCSSLLVNDLLENYNNSELIITVVNGIGVMSQYAGNVILPFSDTVVKLLYHVNNIQSTSALNFDEVVLDDETELILKDNSTSALLKIVLFNPLLLPQEDVQNVVSFVLNNLPLTEDQHEARICHKIFIDQIMGSNIQLLGANLENLPQILRVLVQLIISVQTNEAGEDAVWEAQIISEEMLNKCVMVIKLGFSGKSGLPVDVFKSTLKSFPVEMQRIIEAIVSM
jgi:hypothetical protein